MATEELPDPEQGGAEFRPPVYRPDVFDEPRTNVDDDLLEEVRANMDMALTLRNGWARQQDSPRGRLGNFIAHSVLGERGRQPSLGDLLKADKLEIKAENLFQEAVEVLVQEATNYLKLQNRAD